MLVSEGQRKMEDTKQRILEKSLELFSIKGYDAVSVGEIAKAVDVYKRQQDMERQGPAEHPRCAQPGGVHRCQPEHPGGPRSPQRQRLPLSLIHI